MRYVEARRLPPPGPPGTVRRGPVGPRRHRRRSCLCQPLTDIGLIAGVPAGYGGLAFLPADADSFVIGGAAAGPGGKIYKVAVVRGTGGHITGFAGTATEYSDGGYVDGGVAFGPGGVLFFARYTLNEIGQVKPGSTTAKVVGLTTLGVAASLGGLNFVPPGFPGEGQLKVVSFTDRRWYTVPVTADGSGTYDLGNAVLETTIQGGPEGFLYVPPGSPLFTDYGHVLVAEYGDEKVSSYEISDGGNPILATRKTFLSGLKAEGVAFDPGTGDFLISTFDGANGLIRVQKSSSTSTTTPTPTTTSTTLPVPVALAARFTVTPNPACPVFKTTRFDASASTSPNGPITGYRFEYVEDAVPPGFLIPRPTTRVIADGRDAQVDHLFRWNGFVWGGEASIPPECPLARPLPFAAGGYESIRDDVVVTLTIADASGAEASTTQPVAFVVHNTCEDVTACIDDRVGLDPDTAYVRPE